VLGYGVVEYARMQAVLRAHGWSSRAAVPHGGNQLPLHVAAGLRVVDGRVALTDLPGVGFEAKPALHAVLRSVHDVRCLVAPRTPRTPGAGGPASPVRRAR
jgi:hypothetical protein